MSNQRNYLQWISFVALITVFLNSCKKKDFPAPPVLQPSFSYKIMNDSGYPIRVSFINTSQGTNEYIWDFGNGTTSTTSSPETVYDSSLSYKVKLIAKNGNTTGSIVQQITIPFLSKSVRIIYIIPNDKAFNPSYLNGIKAYAANVQAWYKVQMSGKTYKLNSPIADTIHSSHPTSWFITNNGNGGSDPNSYFLYNGIAFLQSRGVQVGATHIFNLFIPVPGNTSWGIWQTNGRRVAAITERYMINLTSANPGIVNGALGLWGHELGHAYGLDHPIPDDQTTIMSTPNGLSKYPNCILLPHEKNILLNNGFFF